MRFRMFSPDARHFYTVIDFVNDSRFWNARAKQTGTLALGGAPGGVGSFLRTQGSWRPGRWRAPLPPPYARFSTQITNAALIIVCFIRTLITRAESRDRLAPQAGPDGHVEEDADAAIEAVKEIIQTRAADSCWVKNLEKKLSPLTCPRVAKALTVHGWALGQFTRTPYLDGLLATLLEMRARHRLCAEAAIHGSPPHNAKAGKAHALANIEEQIMARPGARRAFEEDARARAGANACILWNCKDCLACAAQVLRT